MSSEITENKTKLEEMLIDGEGFCITRRFPRMPSLSRRGFFKTVSMAGAAVASAGAPAISFPEGGKEEKMTLERVVEVEEGAEAFLEILNANQVDYIFSNPGTDTVPIQEALAKYKSLGKKAPQLILCPHESLAMTAAHGHAMVSGRPQVVLVHVNVGTMNVGGHLHNAYRGKIPIIFCAGKTPMTFEGEMRGGRDIYIHWLQDEFDQGSLVRANVKWDYDLKSNKNIHHVMQRAFQIAQTEPKGPVYLTFARELLMEKASKVKILSPERFGPPGPMQGDPEKLKKAAQLLIKAENPLIIVNELGRNHEAVAKLVKLAELLAIPVLDQRSRMNFPANHPLYKAYDFVTAQYIKGVDLVFVIDCDTPWVPLLAKPPQGAKVICLDVDPVQSSMVMWGYEVDLAIKASSSLALPAIYSYAQQLLIDSDRDKIKERFQRLSDDSQRQREMWKEIALKKASQNPIAPEWLLYNLNELTHEDTIIVNESITNMPATMKYINGSKPGTHFVCGGSCLGWSVGAALGAKLAEPNKRVVAIVGDGGYIFANPTACHWASKVYNVPFLTVILNNRKYGAVEMSLKQQYPEGWSLKNGFIGIDLDPSPSYEMTAKACGVYAETIKDPKEIKSALKRAIDQVDKGNPALLDVAIM